MGNDEQLWSIVLAAGEGSRLRTLTVGADGEPVPKQFCSLDGQRSLLVRTIERAERLATRQRTLAVVAAGHRSWWSRDLAGFPRGNLVVQPCNRGTACGLLLPLMHVLHRDPRAILVVLPSDHFIGDQATFEETISRAVGYVAHNRDRLVLLGVSPDAAESDYGWITPSRDDGGAVHRVVSFVEKPEQDEARRLLESGSLWNSFIFVVAAAALYEFFARVLPSLTRAFSLTFVGNGDRLAEDDVVFLYDHLPTIDFSRTVLEQLGDDLRVLPVPPCGWTDLGTPERVTACLERNGSCPFDGVADRCERAVPVDLASAVQRWRAAGADRRASGVRGPSAET